MSPLWRKSPLVLFRFPALFLSVVASTLLLGAAVVSADLFTSAVGSAALSTGIDRVDRYQAGFAVSQPDGFYGDGDPIRRRDLSFRVRDKLLLEATSTIDHLGGRVLTMLGEPLVVSSPTATETGVGRLVSRTGARDHVTKLAGGDSHGVWMADSTAQTLDLEPGDRINLQSEDGGPRISVEVDGIYRNLRNEAPAPFWSSLYRVIHPDDPLDPDPPPFLLVDPGSMVRLSLRLGQDAADVRWQFPLGTTQLTLDDANRLDRGFAALAGKINRDSKLGRMFPCLGCRRYGTSQVQARQLGHLIAEAEDNVASLRGPLELVSVAGILVALVVIGAAGAYSGHRRRSEVMVLFARGLSPGAMAGKTAVESLLPCLLGALAGAVAADLLVGFLGPAGTPDASGMELALRRALLGVPVAISVIGCVAALGMARESSIRSRERGRLLIPWELPLLLVAGFALVRIFSSGALDLNESDGVPSISPFLLLFPVLFIGALSGWGARAFRRAARRVRDRSDRFPIAPFLAVNRLAAAPRLVRTLLCACALAIGVFVYAHTMSVSLSQTTRAKAFVSVGSDVSVLVDESYDPPRDFAFPTTKVSDILGRPELVGAGLVEVEAINAADIGDVAFWDGRFGRDSLNDLPEDLVRLDAARLPVIAVGEVPLRGALDFQGGVVPFEVTDRVATFPGIAKSPGIVADADELARRAEELGFNPLTDVPVFTDLWVKGDPDRVREALVALGFQEDDIVSLEDVLRRPAFLSTLRTFGFLKVLGAAAALLALIGLALYGQARQRGRAIAFAVSRKMGLTTPAHLRSLLFEFGAILATSGFLGAVLGLTTAGILYSEVDPIPSLSPRPLLNVPNGLWLPLAVALAAAALGGSALAQRAANRANVAEELRRGQ